MFHFKRNRPEISQPDIGQVMKRNSKIRSLIFSTDFSQLVNEQPFAILTMKLCTHPGHPANGTWKFFKTEQEQEELIKDTTALYIVEFAIQLNIYFVCCL